MSYNFPPDLDRFVKDRMAHRGYRSEDEVLRDAFRALEVIGFLCPEPSAGPIPSFEALQREVSRGIEQLERGEGRDAEAVFAELLRESPRPEQD